MRDCAADGLNQLWLSDITEPKAAEGKLYLYAIQDVSSNRFLEYSVSDRMKAHTQAGARSGPA
ncbi:hypothetical protein [Nesterenkonia natronophila]|uniref:Integrase catalytic domain-containing protein n=1 Tax=Nesterenkonia natronophila TaxID=2174932 RepID=A0A3A4G2J3_9MICC|nr:hypothetical protein [Nesterenkonia natronophila]RJN32389.1 hypothetical protein D3250_00570 [Nesterenkonia natronophila]